MVITNSRKWPGFILILIILLSFFTGIAEAQDFALPPNGELLVLPRGESLLIPVFKPKRVAVTDPNIADVVIVNTEQVLVNGISVGTTALQIWEKNGVAYYRVRVVPNPDALIADLRKQLDMPEINIHMLNDQVILDGIIESNAERDRAVRLAGAYGQVIDLLQVTEAPKELDLANEVSEVIQRSSVKVRAVNDYIVLEGEIPSLEERNRAEMLASTFRQSVLNFLEIPSKETPMNVLAEEITQHIAIPTVQVKVIADKTFLLEGNVCDPALKERAATIAHAFGRPVINLIQVEEKSPEIPDSTTADLDGKDCLDPYTTLQADISQKEEVDTPTLELVPTPETQIPPPEEKDIHTWADEIRQELDDPHISLRVIQDAILLEGMVESEHARERTLTIAELYPVRIVNLLQIKDQPTGDLDEEQEWLVRYINDPNIQITLVGKTVLLEGRVDSELSKRRAVAVAKALGLEVVDLLELEEDLLEISEPTNLEEETDTEETAMDICQIIPDIVAALDEENLEVFELNGFIVIEGQVPNEFRKIRAERIAETFQVPLLTLIETESLEKEIQEPTEPMEPANESEPKEEAVQTVPQILSEDITKESDYAQEIAGVIGLPGVVVEMVKGAAILNGVVENELEAQGAEAIASLFADRVVNRLQVIPKADVPGPSVSEMVSEILALPGVQVSLAGEKLLLEGVVSDQDELERAVKIAGAFGKEVVNLIRVEAPLQVLLKVKVVEASRVDLDRVGISWGSMERGVLIPDVAYIGELMIGEPLERLLPFAARLEALVDEGKARLLAAPSLLTLSGQEAEFLSGGEIPVTVPKEGEMQILWKAYGIMLSMRPMVVGENAIEVKVIPEVSTLDWANGIRIDSLTLPAMKTRRTETTVFIEDGTTFVISGLLANTESRQIHKVPLLGDLPIIGKLFRSEQFMTDETELIFFVTPHILRGNEPAMNQELWRDEDMSRGEGFTYAPTVAPADCR